MDWIDKSEEEIKLSLIRTLVRLSMVDGEVQGSELLFILDVGTSYGITEKVVRNLIYEDKTTSIKVPQTEVERMTVLYYLLFLMKIDGKILPQEENLLYHFGFKLGFNESLVRELLIVVKQHLGKKIPPEELIEKIKKYLN